MGCDIHIVLERKWETKWVGVRQLGPVRLQGVYGEHYTKSDDGSYNKTNYAWDRATSRNYDLFARLAGVRGEGPDPKGLPDDVSDLAAMYAQEMEGDAHSHSWELLPDAIEAYLASERDQANMHFLPDDPRIKNGYEHYFGLEFYKDERITPSDYRIVFWFDN